MTKLKAVFGRAGQFIAAHKKAAVALLLAAAIAAGVLVWRQRSAPRLPAGANMGGQSYVRTLTLQKGTLDASISASGTVESSDVSNVTTELKYTVKSVNVQVGDTVNEGDVICTLDTEDLEKSIAKMKESLAEAKEKALKNYQNAQKSLSDAEKSVTEAYDAKEDKRSARDSAKSAYESAEAQVKSYQSAYDSANTALLSALGEQDAKQNAYNTAYNAAKDKYTQEGKSGDELEAAIQGDQTVKDAAAAKEAAEKAGCP